MIHITVAPLDRVSHRWTASLSRMALVALPNVPGPEERIWKAGWRLPLREIHADGIIVDAVDWPEPHQSFFIGRDYHPVSAPCFYQGPGLVSASA